MAVFAVGDFDQKSVTALVGKKVSARFRRGQIRARVGHGCAAAAGRIDRHFVRSRSDRDVGVDFAQAQAVGGDNRRRLSRG
jgi:hypothetical protein